MPCKHVYYRHDGNVAALKVENDFILLCQPFLKEFVKNVKKASSLKSEPLCKIRYRDDKRNKKSITKKKAPCSIHTKINPCYKFFFFWSRLYFYPLAGSEKSVHCCFVELKWFVGDFKHKGDIKVFTYWLPYWREGQKIKNILVELPWRFSSQTITEKEWYEVFAWCISFRPKSSDLTNFQ